MVLRVTQLKVEEVEVVVEQATQVTSLGELAEPVVEVVVEVVVEDLVEAQPAAPVVMVDRVATAT
jgi:hypothetical protein